MSIIGTIGNILGGTVETLGATAYGLGAGAYGLASSAVETVGSTITNLPKIAESAKPLAELAGQAYGVYASLEQKKAAEKAEKLAKYVNVPGVIPTSQSLPISAAIPTLTSYGGTIPETAGGQAPADSQKMLMYGAIALGAILLLKKKK